MTDIFLEGYHAFEDGKPVTANPYEVESDEHDKWREAWYDANRDLDNWQKMQEIWYGD